MRGCLRCSSLAKELLLGIRRPIPATPPKRISLVRAFAPRSPAQAWTLGLPINPPPIVKKEKLPAKPVRQAPAAAPAKPRSELTKPKASPSRPTPPPEHTQPVVRLELYAPAAQKVFVVGSFNNWRPAETAMQLASDGTWIRELALTPGRHEYLFLVDGQWLPDPQAKQYAPNPFGGQNSLLEVPAS
jgi:hypothetical protein